MEYNTLSYIDKPVKKVKKRLTKGAINSQTKKIKKSTRIKPYLSKKFLSLKIFSGKVAKRSLEPSSGGMGIRLKTARSTFIYTIEAVIEIKARLGSETLLSKSPKMTARPILLSGPAKATKASGHLPGFKLYGLL